MSKETLPEVLKEAFIEMSVPTVFIAADDNRHPGFPTGHLGMGVMLYNYSESGNLASHETMWTPKVINEVTSSIGPSGFKHVQCNFAENEANRLYIFERANESKAERLEC